MASHGIWTEEVSRDFYGKVNNLAAKLNTSSSPRVPEDYRTSPRRKTSSELYLLGYEEELHLADHFAFLTQFKEGVEYVSAATLEERPNPPGFTIRLASNHTPSSYVVDGLERALQIIREHAQAGRNGEVYEARLLDEIVSFSQERIYGRIRTSQWKKPRHVQTPKSKHPPLSTRIDQNLQGIWEQSGKRSTDIASLRTALIELREAIKAVDTGPIDLQQDLLKTVILKSHNVSNQGASKSLESRLRNLDIPDRICKSRDVAEIDKLSKYLTICNDLIRLSRQPRTRDYCKNFVLEVCTAFPSSQPPGASDPCFVHGEVQLIIFNERHPRALPPRAIGSSKSACFLCDLFIRNHGRFGVSYSHMKVYHKWTIPDEAWMTPQLRRRLKGVVKGMSNEMKTLLRRGIYHQNTAVESLAHVLLVERGSSTESSVLSPLGSIDVRLSSTSSDTIVPGVGGIAPSANFSVHMFEDLPVRIDFSSDTTFCELSTGGVTYLFEFEVGDGSLHISNATSSIEQQEERINIARLALGEPVSMKTEPEAKSISFVAHADEEHAFRVTVTYMGSAL